MNIISLEASNVKRLKVVRIQPDGRLVVIAGANGSGKTSVLDSIWWALTGKENIDVEPIRVGEERARIRLDLGELIVTRTFARTEDGQTKTGLQVEAASGARYPSPQKVLDELIGALAFDPLAFLRMSAKEQVSTLRTLVKLDVDVDELDRLNAEDFATRTNVNRQIRAHEDRAQTLFIGIDMAANVVVVDIADLLQQLNDAHAHNRAIDERRQRRIDYDRRATAARADADSLRERANALLDQAKAKDIEADELESSVTANDDPGDVIDTVALAGEVKRAEQSNEAARMQLAQREKFDEVKRQLDGSRAAAELLTNTMDQRKRQRREAISSADMPVPGLSFDDGQVMYNDLPLKQASTAEQLRVCFAIGAKQNPKLRVLIMKEASLLDEHSLKLVADMAEREDMQVWLERVDTSGTVGVVMVDGEVANGPEGV